MTYKDMTVLREHSRLTVRIRRWKRQGRDVSKLLNQREALKNKTHKKDKTKTKKLDLTLAPKKDKTPKDKTVVKTNQNNQQLLTQISNQLETLLNLVREQNKEPINHDDLLTKLQVNQQQFFHQLEKLISEKNIIANKAKTESKAKSKRVKNQLLKIDLAELERETGIKKN